ncbi:M20/M25/M40 family metallo-hydrolase [Sphingomonas sp. HT-1]|uniref:M20/M25/M40 family metallo-hydrolase n=1 Tax=unclassified Sphingomonas TaxID=196159 RepID=UPI00035CADA3|nr:MULTISPECIES: M20/M25/M40 family metallo-hydrolase [unclassified Sphingomonas]KTF68041.1 peptidase M20 [Sphingomonas sp. WG]
MTFLRAAAAATTLFAALPADAQQATALRPDQARFLELYKELVETNTVVNEGSCTKAAEQIAARMKAAGFKDEQLTLFSTPEHPKDGGLVAVYPGTSKKAKPILLLAHIDVVAAKREDWTRDPFKLVEESGYYYARGAVDDKAMAASWADTLIRFQQAGYKPKRTVKLALTCGEETTWAFNGAEWLAKNKRDLIDAEFALNEGGGGKSDGKGKVLVQQMQVGEKAVQNYRLETTNPGGHSSIPVPDNAIYQLADALVRIRAYDFPLELSDTTRAYFAKAGAARSDAMGKAMAAIAANPADKAAESLLNTDRIFHSMLRTTCVATLLEGGHANNALPQRAAANINCRIFPGHSSEETLKALTTAIGDAKVSITMVPPVRPIAKPPALDPKVVGPAEKLVAKYFPGVPLVPTMSTGATDAIFLAAVGIPTYGVPGGWGDPDGNGVHGLNERVEIRSLYTGRDYLYDLVKAYAEQE